MFLLLRCSRSEISGACALKAGAARSTLNEGSVSRRCCSQHAGKQTRQYKTLSKGQKAPKGKYGFLQRPAGPLTGRMAPRHPGPYKGHTTHALRQQNSLRLKTLPTFLTSPQSHQKHCQSFETTQKPRSCLRGIIGGQGQHSNRCHK